MSNVDKKLSEIFDVDYVEQPATGTSIATMKTESILSSPDAQETYVKQTILAMMAKGQSAIEELHAIARESEKSRDFEVLFNGMKSITELGEKLLETGKAKNEEKPQGNTTVNQTAVFVGTAAELAKLINDSKS